MKKSEHLELVPRPNVKHINTGNGPCPIRTLVARHGSPSKRRLTQECRLPDTGTFWRQHLRTKDVGPFAVTGFGPFLDTLTEVFKELQVKHPDLYDLMGTAGCICVRLIRGSNNAMSNHSLGLAIDLKIAGSLDARGDNMVQQGLVTFYSIAKKYGLYWGAGFRIEDAMHFEAGTKLISQWEDRGLI